jgi:hypothetical protein
MEVQISLTVSESKRLISKGIVSLGVKRLLKIVDDIKGAG